MTRSEATIIDIIAKQHNLIKSLHDYIQTEQNIWTTLQKANDLMAKRYLEYTQELEKVKAVLQNAVDQRNIDKQQESTDNENDPASS